MPFALRRSNAIRYRVRPTLSRRSRFTLPAAYNAQVRVPFEDPYTPHSSGTSSDNSAVRRNPIIPAIHDAIEKHLALLRPDLFDRSGEAEVEDEVATPDPPAAAAPPSEPDWSKVPPAFKFF
ncbi:hypothetical protein EIP91_006368 [Steccherinum ochraceum]|uniref:Uncharacterized protein n=1 Tax=Steccherinum ochraceum TaxID=92696 RepID=A0A4V2MVJ4_9APHY|nr:hypothetical protein EIP91_006368 [Steccherinum ochraceum]